MDPSCHQTKFSALCALIFDFYFTSIFYCVLSSIFTIWKVLLCFFLHLLCIVLCCHMKMLVLNLAHFCCMLFSVHLLLYESVCVFSATTVRSVLFFWPILLCALHLFVAVWRYFCDFSFVYELHWRSEDFRLGAPTKITYIFMERNEIGVGFTHTAKRLYYLSLYWPTVIL